MQIDHKKISYITNFEVHTLIQKKLESRKKIRGQQTLLYTTQKYMKEKSPAHLQDADQISRFSLQMKPYNMSKHELLMLLNNCPSTQVELSVMISELDTRYTASQIEQILSITREIMPASVDFTSKLNSSGVNEDNSAE
ncbi:unnamed protein product [Protopolystoma xenopodis]|uniref:DNA-directed RNA polymerase III subunit RPC9 n=1 Tax=Protopolystoma xenopodis TaxID=117903 RepID=A0A3S5BJP4_9PLAT|nr:unnamed protein product [Protopolystoma xenopodis]